MGLPKSLGAGSANFLQGKDVSAKGTTVTITEAPRIVESNFKESDGTARKQCRVTIKLPSGIVKPWTMNNTSYKKMVTAFGMEENEWVGKKMVLTKVRQMVRDELRDVIYGEPKV